MPEMPEVEVIRRILEPQLAGRKIAAVEIFNKQILAHPDEITFSNLLTGQTISGMSRRGKYLTIHLENGDSVVLHLRMTGQLLVTPPDMTIEKHTHLIATLSDEMQLRYIDVRRFGRFWYLQFDEPDTFTGQTQLGAEPFDDVLTPVYLKNKLGKRKKPIKEMLHDQSIVAGIGNIYSDEILFSAGIYPKTKCVDLEDSEWNRLTQKIKEVIAWGIDVNEMTPEEYLEGKGKEYRNMPLLRIYGRAGQKCSVCGSTIDKITIGGRSSCYCPSCQMKMFC